MWRKKLKEVKDFEENAYLFSLIEDFSYGIVRVRPAYNNKTILTACKLVISLIQNKIYIQFVALQNDRVSN